MVQNASTHPPFEIDFRHCATLLSRFFDNSEILLLVYVLEVYVLEVVQTVIFMDFVSLKVRFNMMVKEKAKPFFPFHIIILSGLYLTQGLLTMFTVTS